ncbi:hypothetical protein [Pelobacter propionicus]|uniref:hypothetical protein n=1 Tax=Pelobacter propionicus TaxID=29543 RepID=UPI0012EDF055|nr:hypothetical protein [Pelobacter propionicus]
MRHLTVFPDAEAVHLPLSGWRTLHHESGKNNTASDPTSERAKTALLSLSTLRQPVMKPARIQLRLNSLKQGRTEHEYRK